MHLWAPHRRTRTPTVTSPVVVCVHPYPAVPALCPFLNKSYCEKDLMLSVSPFSNSLLGGLSWDCQGFLELLPFHVFDNTVDFLFISFVGFCLYKILNVECPTAPFQLSLSPLSVRLFYLSYEFQYHVCVVASQVYFSVRKKLL